MKKVILFDFFGVISTEVAPIWFSRHFEKDEAARLKASIFERADLGIISEEESYTEMSRLSGIDEREIRREFYSLVKLDREMLEFIGELRKRYPVYVLSNAAKPFLRNILEENQLYSYFDGVFISSELGLGKPDTKYFEYALGKIGVSFDEAVFTDDNPKNVEAARSLGIDSVVFKDFDSFKAELSAFIRL